MEKQIIFILDRSGSMADLTEDTIGGFNSLIKQHRDENASVTVVLFDNEYEVLYKDMHIARVPKLTKKTYFARGSTALLDAIGMTLTSVKDIGNTLCIVITDGYENASQLYNYNLIKDLVENKRKNDWEFLFIGANIDAFSVGSSLGITYTANYTADFSGTQSVYSTVSTVLSGFTTTDTYKVPDDWNKEIE